MKINYNILVDIPKENRKMYARILINKVKHPTKYRHVVNVPGLYESKEMLKAMGYRFRELFI